MNKRILVVVSILLAVTFTFVVVKATQTMAAVTNPPAGVLEISVTNKDVYEVLISGAYFNSYRDCGTWLFIPGTAGECLPGTSSAFSKTHSFPGPGIYTVTLTVNGPGGYITFTKGVIFNQKPLCGMSNTVPRPGENKVNFAADWWHGSPDGEYAFDFGDGSPSIILTGTSGSKFFDHDYAYVEGGMVWYTAGFTVTNHMTTTVCHVQSDIIFDLRPPERHKVYLPLVINVPIPVCSIQVSWQTLNHVVFDVSWSGAGDSAHTFEFGDGTETLQFSGSSGSSSTWHDYPWPQKQFIAKMNLDGGGSCSAQVSVNWP